MNKKNKSLLKKLIKKSMINSWKVDSPKLSDNEFADVIKNTSRTFVRHTSWRQLRLIALEKYGNKCCKCGRVGSPKYPMNVDHIKPRKYYPELAMDIDNLQPLCGRCNKEKGNNNSIDYRKKVII